MRRLVSGNRSSGAPAHRTVGPAREGDGVVLPSHPTGEFLELLRRSAALPAGGPRMEVPPAGRQDAESLDDDRLAVPGFVGEHRTPAGGGGVDRLLPVHDAATVPCLAREAGLDGSRGVTASLPAHGGGLVGGPWPRGLPGLTVPPGLSVLAGPSGPALSGRTSPAA